MAVTNSPRLGLTRWSSGQDPFTRSQMETSHAALDDLVAIDMQGPTLADRPAAGVRGRFYVALDTGLLWRDNGTAWVPVSVRNLNDVPAPTADYSLGGKHLTNVADPVNPQDAATKAYVDAGSKWSAWAQAPTPSGASNFTVQYRYKNDEVQLKGSATFQMPVGGFAFAIVPPAYGPAMDTAMIHGNYYTYSAKIGVGGYFQGSASNASTYTQQFNGVTYIRNI